MTALPPADGSIHTFVLEQEDMDQDHAVYMLRRDFGEGEEQEVSVIFPRIIWDDLNGPAFVTITLQAGDRMTGVIVAPLNAEPPRFEDPAPFDNSKIGGIPARLEYEGNWMGGGLEIEYLPSDQPTKFAKEVTHEEDQEDAEAPTQVSGEQG